MPTKDKKQQFNVPYYPEFVSGGPDFVSGFPVPYGRKGRFPLTLLLRALDFAFCYACDLVPGIQRISFSVIQVATSAVTEGRCAGGRPTSEAR